MTRLSPQRRLRRTTAFAGVAALIIVAVVLAMRSGGSAPSATPATQSQSTGPRTLWHAFAQCLRTHGYPRIADPSFRANGDATFGDQEDQVDLASRALGGTTCRTQLAAVRSPAGHRAPSAAERRRMVRFARCVREHGTPDWPDPRADGTFPLPARLRQAGKGLFTSQLAACARLLPDGIRVSSS